MLPAPIKNKLTAKLGGAGKTLLNYQGLTIRADVSPAPIDAGLH